MWLGIESLELEEMLSQNASALDAHRNTVCSLQRSFKSLTLHNAANHPVRQVFFLKYP